MCGNAYGITVCFVELSGIALRRVKGGWRCREEEVALGSDGTRQYKVSVGE